MNGHSLASVLGTRLSPLLEGLGPPRARPRPGPGGSCPRRTNSARTTSRPVTRISRGTGEPPPTPHRCLGEADAAVHSNPTLPGCGRNIGGSGDSDTFAKARYYNDVRPGQTREGTSRTHSAAPPGRPRHHWAPTAPHWRAPGNRQVTHQIPAGTKQTTSRPAGRKYLSNYPSDLSACPGPTTPKTPEFRTRTSTSRTGQTRISKLDGTFYGRHRRLKH